VRSLRRSQRGRRRRGRVLLLRRSSRSRSGIGSLLRLLVCF
jgi:hypothetical protein